MKKLRFTALVLLVTTLFSAPTFATSNTLDADVIIVGAGLAGLSTAYRLKKAGLTYKILELSPHIGGRMRTASYPENLSAEVGLEEFWEANPTLEIVKELKIPMEKSAATFSSFVLNGKLIPYTQSTNQEFLQSIFTNEELAAFQKWDAHMVELFRSTTERPLKKEMQKLMDVSFGDWVAKESKLTKKVQEFIRIHSEPEYATSWKSISALDGIMEWHIFSNGGMASYHTVGGNQVLAQKIADAIGNNHIMLNSKVTGIVATDDGVTVNAVDQGNYQQRSYRGKYAVTTQQLFRLGEMQFIPPLTEERRKAIQTQSWGSYFTAHVMMKGEAAKYWTVNGASILPILSDSPLGVMYGNFDPKEKNEHILLNLLITASDAERFNLRAVIAMDSIRQELATVFEKKWPGSSKLIEKFEFYQYHPRAIASWPVGRSRADSLSDLIRQPQGRVYLAGDFTESTHSDGAALSAIRVAADIAKKEKK